MNDAVKDFIYGAFKDLRQFMASLINFWTEIEAKGGRENGTASFYGKFSVR